MNYPPHREDCCCSSCIPDPTPYLKLGQAIEPRLAFVDGNKTYLTISSDGIVKLGPDVTWDEAATFFLDALERQIGRRIVGVERPKPAQSTFSFSWDTVDGEIAYSDETEEWTLGCKVEGRMSGLLARQVLAKCVAPDVGAAVQLTATMPSAAPDDVVRAAIVEAAHLWVRDMRACHFCDYGSPDDDGGDRGHREECPFMAAECWREESKARVLAFAGKAADGPTPSVALPRGPTLAEAIEYGDRRFRAAEADGKSQAAGAYLMLLDFMRNARFDVPAAADGSGAVGVPPWPCVGCRTVVESLRSQVEAGRTIVRDTIEACARAVENAESGETSDVQTAIRALAAPFTSPERFICNCGCGGVDRCRAEDAAPTKGSAR